MGMAALSVMQSATEGFSLIRRRPWAFVGWILFWLVLGVGPFLIAIAGLAPKFIDLISSIRTARDAHDPVALQRILDFEFGMWSVIGPWFFWLLIVGTVLYAAVYRAILEPGKNAFAYLRLGMDEVRLFFTQIVIVLLVFVFFALLGGGGAALLVFSHNVIGHPWEGWFDALVIVAAICLFFWVMFLLSLPLPMTFAEKHIRIFESWRLTRGHFWPLVGVWAMSVVLIFAVAIGFGFVRQFAFLAVGLSTGAFDQLDSLKTMGNDLRKGITGLMAAFGPAFIALFVIQAIADAVVRVVAIAPFARAYAQLSGREPPVDQGS
jgi:MFS family permease